MHKMNQNKTESTLIKVRKGLIKQVKKIYYNKNMYKKKRADAKKSSLTNSAEVLMSKEDNFEWNNEYMI